MLVYLGTAGQMLWASAAADAPPSLEPLIQSANGENVLVMEGAGRKWRAVARTFLGNETMQVGGAGRIKDAALTSNGRFAMVLWSRPDAPLLYTFLDIEKKRRHEFPAADVLLGKARIVESGVIKAGDDVLYRFEASD